MSNTTTTNSPRPRLFRWEDPYDLSGSSALFLEAVRENVSWHASRCPRYARILERENFSPRMIKGEEDLWKIPVIPTLYIKRNRLCSIPKNQVRHTAVSSGTGGVRSRVIYDFSSLACGAAMVKTVLSYHGIFSPVPCRYLVMGYEPYAGVETGTVQTAFGATFAAPAASRTYALKRDEDGEYRLNRDGLRRELSRLIKEEQTESPFRLPLRIVGFPSYIFFLASELDKRGIRLSLPPSSCVLMSGGWKTFWRQEIGRDEFYHLVERVFGIPSARVFEFFSAVEHNILYRCCKEGHFHVPVYSRVIVRNPDTLEPVPDGEPGILSFVTPLMTGMPLVSVMTDDLAVMGRPEPGKTCACGCSTPYFKLLGRAGARQLVTCAAGAAEKLKEAVNESF